MAFVARFVSYLASVRLPSGNQTKAIPFISEFVILTHLNPKNFTNPIELTKINKTAQRRIHAEDDTIFESK